MGSDHRLSQSSSTKLFRTAVVVGLAVVVASLGTILTALHESQNRSHEQVEQALSVVNAVRLIDGLEWRAVAGEAPEGAAGLFDLAFEDLHGQVAEIRDDPNSAELMIEADRYVEAVDDMLAALTAGDLDLADQIDETQVGPGFELVLSLAEIVTENQHASAEKTQETVQRLMWLSLSAITAGLAMVLSIVLGSRERQRTRELRNEADQRLRSFVEGSQDVITVVSGVDDLTVMTPTLGVFERFSHAGNRDRVRDLLPPEAYLAWCSIDDRVKGDGTRQYLEVTLSESDGIAHLEGHGSPLVSDSTQRVWVWRDITARKELEQQLSHQAFHDSLTGVANRSLLHDRVEHALSIAGRANKPVTVMFCDVDDFKTINDSLGHDQGDELLKVITKRISTCVRDSDTVARLGGDEFAVLLEDADTEQAIALAERIISVVSYQVDLDGRPVFPSISVGIATAIVGTTTEELLRNADLAMYAAKRAGKSRAQVYENQMHTITSDLLELQTDLKAALNGGQLSLNYQPTISLTDNTVEGVEALLRWEHPTRGNIPPDQFIHIAEASGMIIAIGRWVLQQACQAAVELQNDQVKPVLMAVNISPQQLRDPTIVATVKQALEESGLPPERLVLEVTEGTLLDDRNAVERLHELRQTGVLIAIDDFGTGYTSVNYLQSLPISILKIDRSFISGDALAPSERRAFLHAIIGLAKSLNLHSIAEGIEDNTQLDELKQLGCDTGQGYLWAKPTSLPTTHNTIKHFKTRAVGVEGPVDEVGLRHPVA